MSSAVEQLEQTDPTEQTDNYFAIHGFNPDEHDTVLFYGAGANTRHLLEAGGLGQLMAKVPVIFLERGESQIDIPDGQLIRTDTPAGEAEARRLMESGGIHATYISTPPRTHRQIIEDNLGYAGEGKLSRVVVAKPVVTNLAEVDAVDVALWEAEWQRKTLGIPMPKVGEEEKAFLYAHEHYQRKEAWNEFRQRLGEIMAILGRPNSVTVDIEELVTIEEEHRERAFAGGALEDLGPHTTSLFLDVAHAINKDTDRYSMSSVMSSYVDRFRYTPTALQDDVETGFITHGATKLFDHAKGEEHDVDFTLMGGKGLSNRKEAVITFRHPNTNDETAITVDLKRNKIHLPDDAPQALKDLFPKTEFTDNGYGRIVLAGLNGGNPDISFQHWYQAKVVAYWVDKLARQGRQTDLRTHSIGTPLREMDRLQTRAAGSRAYLVASVGGHAIKCA